MNLPNQITLARLGIAVVFCILLAKFDCRRIDEQRWMLDVAFCLFMVGALTDFLDGYLARKYNQVTALGRMLDPFVDKILVGGGFILFLGAGFVDATGRNITDLAAWMVVVIISRELLVSSVRGISEGAGKAYGANVWGKTKMVIQSIAVAWVIVSHGWFRGLPLFTEGRRYVVVAAVLFTAISALAYMPASRAILAEPRRD